METVTEFPDDLLVSAPVVCREAGVSYRQIDYWCRVGLIEPAHEARGSGSQRAFEAEQIATVRIVGTLVRLGVDHDRIRTVVERVEREGPTGTYLAWPGVTVDLAVVAQNPPPSPTRTPTRTVRRPAPRPRPRW